MAYCAMYVVAFFAESHEAHIDSGFFRDTRYPFTVGSFSSTKSQAFKVRFGGKDVPKRETIAPNRGSLNGKPVVWGGENYGWQLDE